MRRLKSSGGLCEQEFEIENETDGFSRSRAGRPAAEGAGEPGLGRTVRMYAVGERLLTPQLGVMWMPTPRVHGPRREGVLRGKRRLKGGQRQVVVTALFQS